MIAIMTCINLVVMICIIIITVSTVKTNRQVANKKEYIDVDFDNIITTFDNIIDKEIDTYFRFHPDLMQEGVTYIKEDDINQIIIDITAAVMQNVTPAIKNNLSFVYNIGDDDVALTSIVGRKVGLVVVGMAAKINNSMTDDTIIKG